MDPTPHRPEAGRPLDELSPALRAAVESARNQPVPSEAQEEALRRIEEKPPMSNRLPTPFWARPSIAATILAASVAIAFCAGYFLRPAPAAEPQLALNTEKPQPPAVPEKQPTTPVPDGGAEHLEKSASDPTAKTPERTTTTTPHATGGSGTVLTTGTTATPGSPVVPVTSPPPVGQPANPIAPGLPGLPGPGGLPTPGTGVPGPGYTAPAGPVAPLPAEPGSIPPVVLTPTPAPRPATEGKGKEEAKPGEAPAQGQPQVGDSSEMLKKEIKSLKADQQKIVATTLEAWGKLPERERKSEHLLKLLDKQVNDLPADKRLAIVAAAQAGGIPAGDTATGGESYNHFVDNPYQAVQNAPLSTFSTAVDTASYANVRRFLMQEGRLPPRDAVRLADMLNYFPYEYPQPQGEHPVAFAMNMATCPWNDQHQLLRVSLAARTYEPTQMPPRNFVFLLDTSGSMSPENRLPLLVKGFKMFVETLRAQDRVAIVVYAGSAGLVLDSTPGNQKQKILEALDRLQAGGSTNGGDGLRLAYKVAQDNYIKGGVNRVVLGTDGDWNVGTTDQAELIRLIEEKRKTNVYLTILGFGFGNLKDATLERLAHHGNGYFAYIDSENEAKKVFLEQGGALATVAKDVKLQIEFNPQRVAGYRLIGYENKLLRDQDFNDDTVDAGDMGSGHTVTALYEIVPAGTKVPNVQVEDLKYQKPALPAEAANTGEFLTVKLRYKDPEADTSKKLEQPLAGAVENFEKAHYDLRWAAAVAEFGMLLRDSPYKGTASYTHALETAEKALGAEDKHRVEFLALIKKARELDRPAEKKPE